MSIMKRVVLATLLLAVPAASWAQQPQTLPANVQALQQTVIELTGEKLDWRTQAITLQAQIADLQKQLAEAKKESK